MKLDNKAIIGDTLLGTSWGNNWKQLGYSWGQALGDAGKQQSVKQVGDKLGNTIGEHVLGNKMENTAGEHD